MKVAVIGAGSWGTALAVQLERAGQDVTIWAYEKEVAEAVNKKHENSVFLPGFPLASGIKASNSLEEACARAEMVVLVMPSHVFRHVITDAAPFITPGTPLVSCSKGIEKGTGNTMCDVARDVLSKEHYDYLACLSGPSFAREVAAGAPTLVTVAARKPELAARIQKNFASPSFRVYTSPDLTGVELGGAVKNPLAIAAGMAAGLKLGHNTLAALITRGLAEMTRLCKAIGGQQMTLSGLAGLGDLVLTCTGELSRNRTVGFRLGQGEKIKDITDSMKMVAEGVHNTLTVKELAERNRVEMPIVNAVYHVIYEGMRPADAVTELMTRSLKNEHYM